MYIKFLLKYFEPSPSTSTFCFSFYQALIVNDAYPYKINWSHVVFEMFIIKNFPNYLEDFLTTFPLTEKLVKEVSRRYLALNEINDNINKNMQTLVSKLMSVHEKYKLASELGFTDLLEELLIGGQLSYQRDTVWKSGYKELDF